METNSAYLSYINSTKDLKSFQGRIDYQKDYAQSFESIYKNAQEENVNLQNAKSILSSLTKDQLNTIKQYQSLADTINIDNLNDEGAYNLLMHDNEKYDFDADGYTQTGLALGSASVQNMTSDVRSAYINSMNSLNDEEKMNISGLFHLGNISIDGSKITNEQQTIDFDSVKQKVEQILNPTPPAFSSQEVKESVKKFWDSFVENYNQTNTNSTKTQTSSETKNTEVEQFLKDLREKGALNFLADLNKEKIEKMIQEKVDKYKQNLLSQGEQTPESLAEINKLTEDYKKSLIEELKNSLDNSDQKDHISNDGAIKFLLDSKSSEKNLLTQLLESKS